MYVCTCMWVRAYTIAHLDMCDYPRVCTCTCKYVQCTRVCRSTTTTPTDAEQKNRRTYCVEEITHRHLPSPRRLRLQFLAWKHPPFVSSGKLFHLIYLPPVGPSNLCSWLAWKPSCLSSFAVWTAGAGPQSDLCGPQSDLEEDWPSRVPWIYRALARFRFSDCADPAELTPHLTHWPYSVQILQS